MARELKRWTVTVALTVRAEDKDGAYNAANCALNDGTRDNATIEQYEIYDDVMPEGVSVHHDPTFGLTDRDEKCLDCGRVECVCGTDESNERGGAF